MTFSKVLLDVLDRLFHQRAHIARAVHSLLLANGRDVLARRRPDVEVDVGQRLLVAVHEVIEETLRRIHVAQGLLAVLGVVAHEFRRVFYAHALQRGRGCVEPAGVAPHLARFMCMMWTATGAGT